MRSRLFPFLAPLLSFSFLALFAAAQNTPGPVSSDPQTKELFNQVIANQKKVDATLDVCERIEKVESRKSGSDLVTGQIKFQRVVPAGTGSARIPVNEGGQPLNADSYRAELEKLEHSLVWAADAGRAQEDAYAKIAKKRKERNALIEAAKDAFIFTFLDREQRNERTLLKYRMEPNPAFKPTSRATSIYQKVRGTLWIDESSAQLARIEGEVVEDISIGLFLAKVNKGSRFMQESYEVLPGFWLPTYSQYDFDGRKFFSNFSIHERTFYTNYRRIGPPKEALVSIRAELGKPASIPTAR